MFLKNLSISSKHNAFTMAELLITLGLIGVIAALSMPQIFKNLPRQDAEMERKITYTVEHTIANMFEDNTMYPKTSDDTKEGFMNTDEVFVGGRSYSGDTKFCRLLASKLNIVNLNEYNESEDDTNKTDICGEDISDLWDGNKNEAPYPIFITNDGAYWYVPKTNFNEAGKQGYTMITVDVNGNKGPNCSKFSTTANCVTAQDKAKNNPDRYSLDRYVYYVKYNGTVTRENPATANINSREFELQVNITTRKSDNSLDSPANKGGTVTIKDCGTSGGASCDSATAQSMTYTGNSYKKTGLQRNHVYLLVANPKEDYMSTWNNNQKKFIITNKDITSSISFRQVSKSNIELIVSGCSESSPNDCGTVKLKRNCRYKEASPAGSGTHKYNSEYDVYMYAGINDPDANYDYKCYTDAEGTTPDPGTNGTIDGMTYKWNNLHTGDYAIEITPKSPYTIPNLKDGKYIQSVRLGNEDASFTAKYETTAP